MAKLNLKWTFVLSVIMIVSALVFLFPGAGDVQSSDCWWYYYDEEEDLCYCYLYAIYGCDNCWQSNPHQCNLTGCPCTAEP